MMVNTGKAYLAFFASMRRESLDELEMLTAPLVRFRDPFHDVIGRPAMRRIFEKMFDEMVHPRFHILHHASDGDTWFALWQFKGHCHRQATPLVVEGTTVFQLDSAGLVCDHTDYWDAGSQLYERIPLLAPIIRFARKRIATP
jgi:ketosteroid isomerase-like protein